MPATTGVNDARTRPWFFVSMEANDGLLQALDRDVLPRKEIEGCVTVVFDREGWSPETFRRWAAEGVTTYRKGRYSPWPEDTAVGTGVSLASGVDGASNDMPDQVWRNGSPPKRILNK